MTRIVVKINKIGDTKIEVDGATGQSCVQLTAGIEAALNGVEVNREYKPEYNEAEVDQTQENG